MELERDVERYLCRRVEALGGICLKHGQDGWPDRIVMLPGGKLTWVELKRRVGVQSDLQRYRAQELMQVHQEVRTIWSREEVDQLISEEGQH